MLTKRNYIVICSSTCMRDQLQTTSILPFKLFIVMVACFTQSIARYRKPFLLRCVTLKSDTDLQCKCFTEKPFAEENFEISRRSRTFFISCSHDVVINVYGKYATRASLITTQQTRDRRPTLDPDPDLSALRTPHTMDQDAARRRRRDSSSLSAKNGNADTTTSRTGRKVRKRRKKKHSLLRVGLALLTTLLMLFLGYTCYRWATSRTRITHETDSGEYDWAGAKHDKVKVSQAFLDNGVHVNAKRKMHAAAITTPLKHVACDKEALSDFLHDDPVEGMHVVCVEEGTSVGNLEINVFPGAQLGSRQETMSEFSWYGVRDSLITALRLRTTDALHQPWAIFTSLGERIVAEDYPFDENSEDSHVVKSILDAGMILLFEGGQWLWPGVRVGFKRYIDLYSIMPTPGKSYKPKDARTAVLETLSLRPLVLSVEGFLSDEECDYIQEKAAPKMSYSGVVLMDKDKDRPASDFRTSQSTFLHLNEDMLTDIDYRTASLVRIPRSHQEQVQVLRYGVTEKYNAHHDFFDPAMYKHDAGTMRLIQNGRKNRLATVFWYLSDVEEGGETAFPRWNGAPSPRDLADCSYGLKVKPQRGKVIIFYSMTPGGDRDPLSLHAACPVKKGLKWAGNK